MPTFRRPQLLERCLEALLAQTLDGRHFEIVVADDGADDATRKVVTALHARRARPALHYVAVGPRHGPAAARNCGWRAATADIIAFTDDDTVPAADWLEAGLAAFNDGVDAAWGELVMPHAAICTDYERDAAQLASAEFVTANCFVRRRRLDAIGGFDERFTSAWREDSDLLFTLIEHGAQPVHAPRARVTHPIRPAGWGVSLSQQRKIRFDALLYKKHPRLYRARIRRSPQWRYYAIVAALIIALAATAAGAVVVAAVAWTIWASFTLAFFVQRQRGASRAWRHVLEMLVTSIAIPPLAVFWRLVGAIQFRSRLW